MIITDFHTHAFPDGLAERTVPMQAAKADLLPALDGKVASPVLFGADAPWAGQRETLDLLRSFELGEERERAILSETARNLLDS